MDDTDDILAAISLWEDARMKSVFSAEQKQLMEDVNNEFHLEKADDGLLYLSRIYPYRITHENKQRQPGEPLTSNMEFENPGDEQVIQFIISAKKGIIINPVLEFDGNRIITIPVKLNEGEHVKFDGKYASIYSSQWKLMKSISINIDLLTCTPGVHTIEVESEFEDRKGEMGVELRIEGKTEIIELN